MLMKLTASVNLTNILKAAFVCSDPESAKKIDNLTVFFALLGSAHAKAAYIILMKLPLTVFVVMCLPSFMVIVWEE